MHHLHVCIFCVLHGPSPDCVLLLPVYLTSPDCVLDLSVCITCLSASHSSVHHLTVLFLPVCLTSPDCVCDVT